MGDLKSRFIERFEAFASALDGLGRMALWALLSLLLLAVIAVYINPAKIGSYLWIVSKLSLAAVLGYCFDRAANPDARPSQLQGLEQSMAFSRRALLIAAALVSAGLMP